MNTIELLSDLNKELESKLAALVKEMEAKEDAVTNQVWNMLEEMIGGNRCGR